MKILKLNSPGTVDALRLPEFEGLKLIGRGAFCAVFDKGDTVLKLTADSVQSEFQRFGSDSEIPCFPKLVQYHGEVGKQGDLPLYMMEVEKLSPFGKRATVSNKAWGDRKLLMSAAKEHHLDEALKHWKIKNPIHYNTMIGTGVLQKLSEDERLSPLLRDACEWLAGFLSNYSASIDFHNGNFMLRGDEIVLNDVVADNETLCCISSRRECY